MFSRTEGRSTSGLQRGAHLRPDVGAKPEVGLRGPVERCHALGGPARDREATRVVHFSFE
jgi:hypothetical protein